ncbi:MAG: demethoxyubiquinone hydroxylase family protein [Gammaproteobacteria bacterium]|jgi:demethoxyubiquinone hydroxylase (CLK1/Coq7/Cat5 family)
MSNCSENPVTVFYDGACPLCDREISFYRRREGAGSVRWVDVSQAHQDMLAPDLTREQALARFHVRDGTGELTSGGAAFTRLWSELPGFRTLGRIFRLPPLAWLLERGYDLFLRFRPRLQSLAADRAEERPDGFPRWLVRDLRSDHAGETGAVAIYRGILRASRDPVIRRFAAVHLETERAHLERIEAVLPVEDRSRLLPVWRGAGFLTGAMPALFGRGAVYATIDAVESFVDRHYADQIRKLSALDLHPELRSLLEQCREDELHHRDEARASLARPDGLIPGIWRWLVGAGSAGAVVLARRF